MVALSAGGASKEEEKRIKESRSVRQEEGEKKGGTQTAVESPAVILVLSSSTWGPSQMKVDQHTLHTARLLLRSQPHTPTVTTVRVWDSAFVERKGTPRLLFDLALMYEAFDDITAADPDLMGLTAPTQTLLFAVLILLRSFDLFSFFHFSNGATSCCS